jgi:hypothetical protein
VSPDELKALAQAAQDQEIQKLRGLAYDIREVDATDFRFVPDIRPAERKNALD